MESDPSLFDFLFAIVATPIQLLQFIVFSVLDFLAFDLLQLGPFLPIVF